MDEDIKSYSRNHTHKYFIYQVKKDFEPLPETYNNGVYKMTEYAYSGCPCGSVIKVPVKDHKED